MIKGVDWDSLIVEDGTDQSYKSFISTFGEIFNTAFPKTIIRSKYKNRKPWLGEDLKKSIQHKNKLYKLSRKYPVMDTIRNYKSFKCNLKKLLKQAEKNYFQELFEQYSGNMQRTWGIIKRIINKSSSNSMRSMIKSNDRMITDDTEIANVFNEFFASVGPDLAKHIPETGKCPTEYIKNVTINSIVLENVTEKELINVINSLKKLSCRTWWNWVKAH